ncbi:MAG: HD domain-containing protein [Candidatus Saccharimonadaceae bacterium]
MTERTTTIERPLDYYEKASAAIKQLALDEVAARYGTGLPDTEPGIIDNPAYHNLQHSTRVAETAEKIAQELGLSRKSMLIAGMAGAAHDIIRERTTEKTAEQLSADWLGMAMIELGFATPDIVTGRNAILATTPIITPEGLMVGQQVETTHFSDDFVSTDTLIAQSVASADLEALYAPDGPIVAHKYFMELQGLQPGETPLSLEALRDFQLKQVILMRHYRYPHPVAEELFGKDRETVTAYHQMLFELIDNGTVTSWSQVAEMDRRFFDEQTQSTI